MDMRIVILNCCGSVGKTTLATHFLAARVPDAEIFSIESINESVGNFGVQNEAMRGDDFEKLYKRMLVASNAIIDVGASNVELFLGKMTGFDEGHDEFDIFVIPTVPGAKEAKETLQTIYALKSIGVPAEKIKIIFNKVVRDVEAEFSELLNYLRTNKKTYECDYDIKAVVYDHSSFSTLSMRKVQLSTIMGDSTDYKTQLRALDKSSRNYTSEFNRISDMIILQKTAKNININFDELWSVLFAKNEMKVE